MTLADRGFLDLPDMRLEYRMIGPRPDAAPTLVLLHGLGLPTDFFTPTFAVGRVAGWAAHCLEQLKEGKLIRPQSVYVGPTGLQYERQPQS